MKETGIRNFCESICGGHCCGTKCYKSKNACHKNEGRRISCSIFICGAMRHDFFTAKECSYLWGAKRQVENDMFPYFGFGGNCYYEPMTTKQIEDIRFNNKIITNLEKINVKKVKKKVKEVIRTMTPKQIKEHVRVNYW